MPRLQAPHHQDQEQARQIGARITAARKAKGITQVDVAARLGTTQGVLSKYERGELRLHGAVLVKLAEILSVSTDELLGVKVPPAPPIPILKDKRLRRRIHQIDKLSKRDREALIRTIDVYIQRAEIASGGATHRKAG